MELTQEVLKQFVGLQAQILDLEEHTLHQGEVKTIRLTEGTIQIEFEWFLRDDGYPRACHPRWSPMMGLDFNAPIWSLTAQVQPNGCIVCSSFKAAVLLAFLPRGNAQNLSRPVDADLVQ